MRPYEHHPIAAIFPLMTDDGIELLAADILEHGLREPIMLFEGKVLDGRNRLAACIAAKVTPRFAEFRGETVEAVALVWSVNCRRRHLNSSQIAIAEAKRVAIDAEYAARREAESKARMSEGGAQAGRGRPLLDRPRQRISNPIEPVALRDERARTLGTNNSYLSTASRIVEARPDLAEKIEQGEMTIPKAKLELQRQEKREQLEAKAAVAPKPKAGRIVCGVLPEALSEIEPGSVRLAFADPPYNIGVDYGLGSSADRLPPAKYLDWCRSWMQALADLLADDGSLWVMISDEWADHYGVILRETGLHRRAWIKWYETFGVNCQNNFNRTSRHIFHCVKNPKRFVFNADAVSRPSDRQTKYGDPRANPNGKLWDDVWEIPRLVGSATERIPDFPTQLPLAICRAIVGCASEPGDLVVEGFSGSAGIGVACLESGRRYVGFDREERFCQLARRRLAGT